MKIKSNYALLLDEGLKGLKYIKNLLKDLEKSPKDKKIKKSTGTKENKDRQIGFADDGL